MTHGVRVAAIAAAVALAACGDVGVRPGAADPVPRASDVAAPATPAPARPSPLPADAVSVAPPAEFDRYPALAAAVQAAATGARERFEADVRAAAARGEAVAGWTLRIEWRVLRGNRYLWLAEGEGAAVRGAGGSTPVHVRLAYDGIDKKVLQFADWFEPEAWPAVVAMLRSRLPAEMRASPPGALRTLDYEPIHRPEGQVMRFDLLLPTAGDGAPRRVQVPREAVEQWIGDGRRVLLDATAAGP